MLPCYHGQLSGSGAERKLEGLSNTFLVRQSVVEEKFIVSKVDDRKKMSHYLVPTTSEAGDPMEDVRRLIAANNFGHPHLCQEGGGGAGGPGGPGEALEGGGGGGDHSTTTFPKLACHVCQETVEFDNWKKKANHVKIHRLAKCDKCGLYIPENSFSKHRAKCLKEMQSCALCDYKTVHKYDLKIHMKSHEKKEKETATTVCPDCGKNFSNKANLKKHRKSHKSQQLEENQTCDQKFLVDVFESLEIQLTTIHNRGARTTLSKLLEGCEGRLRRSVTLSTVEEISSICISLYRYHKISL